MLILALSNWESLFALENKKVKLHNKTDNFIDIETHVDQLNIDISGADKKEDICLMGFDIFDDEKVYSFYYRRPQTIKQCKEEKAEYLKILKKAKIFRIVGVGSLEAKQEPVPKYFLSKKLNKKQNAMTIAVPFIRLQVGKKCKAYFSTDCDLPKNYWAGTIPPK